MREAIVRRRRRLDLAQIRLVAYVVTRCFRRPHPSRRPAVVVTVAVWFVALFLATVLVRLWEPVHSTSAPCR